MHAQPRVRACLSMKELSDSDSTLMRVAVKSGPLALCGAPSCVRVKLSTASALSNHRQSSPTQRWGKVKGMRACVYERKGRSPLKG